MLDPHVRRPFPLAPLLLALAVAPAACSGTRTAPEGPTALPPAPKQELRIAVGDDPYLRGNPPAQNVGLVTAAVNPGIFETFVQLTPAFGSAPGLATRWQALSPTRWRFTLRRGVTFHDGRPFDAPAAYAALESVAARGTRPRGLDPGTMKIVADDAVEVNLATPNYRLAEQLANPAFAVQAPGTRAGDGSVPASTPTGTGPFRFASYAPGSQLTVQAFEGYWGPKPRLTSITLRFGPGQDASRLLSVGQVDAVGIVPYQNLAQLSDRFGRVAASRPARSAYLLLNVGGPEPYATLKEEGVRRAVALALDRRGVASAGWGEFAEASASVIAPMVLGIAGDDVRAAPHDPGAARRLLDEAGWRPGPGGIREKEGTKLSLTLILARPAEQQAAAQDVVSQLREVGIDVEIVDPGPGGAAFGRVNQATFDLFMDLRYQEDANPCSLCRFFSIGPGGQLTVSGAVRAGEKADELFERSFQASSPEAVRNLAGQLMEVVSGEQVVAVPLAALRTVWLASGRLQAFEPAPLPGAQRWDQTWLSI